jgi:hypothetical protein
MVREHRLVNWKSWCANTTGKLKSWYANIRFGLVNWNYGTRTTHTQISVYQNDVRVPWFQFTDGVRVLVSIYQTMFAYHDFNLPAVFAYCDFNLPHGVRVPWFNLPVLFAYYDFNLPNHIRVLWFQFNSRTVISVYRTPAHLYLHGEIKYFPQYIFNKKTKSSKFSKNAKNRYFFFEILI